MIRLDTNALVWGIVGNLGGGKTMSGVAACVAEMIERQVMVVSNVRFNTDDIARVYRAPWATRLFRHISLDDPGFDPFELPCGDPRGSGGRRRVIILLDEVAEWIDQYSSAKDPRISRLWSWLRHSSKRSQDVMIICQRQEFINKVVRTLIARWIWVDDMAVYRVPILKIKLPFCSGLVMQNVFDRLGNRVASTSFISKKNWGRFYNTAECLNASGASVNEVYELPELHYTFNKLSFLLWVGSFGYILYNLLL